MKTAWQRHDVASQFLDETRGCIPFATDQLQVMLRVIEHYVGAPDRFVDLGCGDGILARTIMDAYPSSTALLVDHSQPMLIRAAQAMHRFAHRFNIAQADISEALPAEVYGSTIDVVVSAFAIHHLPSDRKQWLYKEIFKVLRPGGMFINLEHVTPASDRAEALFDQLIIENLVSVSGRPETDVAAEYHARPDKADNILETIDQQIGWLNEIGYTDVDCYFKFLELAMFGGVKPA
jgi:ubiquinone/menaquinone biosynthesis C-methylase UbiE